MEPRAEMTSKGHCGPPPPRDATFETPPTRFAHFYKWIKETRVDASNPEKPRKTSGREGSGGGPLNQSIPRLHRGPLTLHFVPQGTVADIYTYIYMCVCVYVFVTCVYFLIVLC